MAEERRERPEIIIRLTWNVLKVLTTIDEEHSLRQSHNNPMVKELYKSKVLGEPNSHLAHELLHTEYQDPEKW